MKSFILSLVAIFTTVALHAADTTQYVNKEKGYSISYPSNWTKNEDLQGFDLFVMSPKDANQRSLANFSIISGPIPQEINLQTYYDENMKFLQKENKTIKIKETGNTTISGVPAYFVRYVNEQDETEIVHYFFISDNKAFLLTDGVLKGHYDEYKKDFDDILSSFKLS